MCKLYILLITLLMVNTVSSQSCLPEGIIFSTQTQIDNFQVNNPGCTEIEGNVTIRDNYTSNITNLNGLNVLTSIGGSLYIEMNNGLTSLSGLDNISSVAGSMGIQYNPLLVNLTGLGNLITIGEGLNLESNTALASLTGLEKLTSIGGNFSLYENAITSMTGLQSLTYAGRLGIANNNALSTLNGLESLTTIGSDLIITWNGTLASLAGLEDLNAIDGEIQIHDNSLLTSLSGLDSLDASTVTSMAIVNNYSLSTCSIESVCNYLENHYGDFTVFSNAPGCDSHEEVVEACGFGLDEHTGGNRFSIFPNPASDQFTVTFTLEHPAHVNMEIYNRLGQIIAVILNESLVEGRHEVQWKDSRLPSGIYCYRFTEGRQSSIGKIVVVR
jgi:hypothetical protein